MLKMKPITRKYTLKSALRTLLYTVGINTTIALVLCLTDFRSQFTPNLIYSQCIGLSICVCVMAVVHSAKTQRGKLLWMAGAILVGAGAGLLMACRLTGVNLALEPHPYGQLFSNLVTALVFGIAVSYFFISRYQIADSESTVQQERIRRLSMEKEIAETRLKLLQAQIEPHFLFNTLSNVLGLMETDQAQATAMLTNLTRFLRATLERTRDRDTTLGQELEVIRAYLNVLKVRMGKRLVYRIDVPEELLPATFAPLLLQPLVENAVRHGLEPLIEGGKIFVGAENRNDALHVWVSDTGVGLQDRDLDNRGFGLSNINQRLETLYGRDARLVLEENPAAGLKATIEVPIG
jgi:signal transduction histidine kinase